MELSVYETLTWITGLLWIIFRGKDITNNPCEGRFGSLALEIRLHRFAVLKRHLTFLALRRQGPHRIYEWLQENYPISRMGEQATHVSRTVFKVGCPYEVLYRNGAGEVTERVIVVREKRGKYIYAFCELRNEERCFLRSRILKIKPL